MADTMLQMLLTRLLNGTITIAEKEELARLVQETEDEALGEQINHIWQQGQLGEPLSPAQPEALFTAIMQQARPVRNMKWRWYAAAAAASVVLVLAIVAYQFFNKTPTPAVVVATTPKDIPAPQTNRARITLSDGSEVLLDSIGVLAQQGNMQIVTEANGQIVYKKLNNEISNLTNTLSNPRGSQVIDMTLSDGSRIWLNAGSSLTYPVAFTGNERKVTITGEAYFEVAKDKSRPFIVSKGSTNVQVLGTHFNVNAYDDEANAKITLLEGKVKVNNTILKPGQQAVLTHDSRLTVHDNVDTDAVMAWRNGHFVFEDGTDIHVIMRQIARWYDVDIQYKGTIDKQLGGSISRNASLLKVLDMLQTTGTVHFILEGKRLIVQP